MAFYQIKKMSRLNAGINIHSLQRKGSLHKVIIHLLNIAWKEEVASCGNVYNKPMVSIFYASVKI